MAGKALARAYEAWFPDLICVFPVHRSVLSGICIKPAITRYRITEEAAPLCSGLSVQAAIDLFWRTRIRVVDRFRAISCAATGKRLPFTFYPRAGLK